MASPRVQFEAFELDLAAYQLRRKGRPLKLEKLPMELLILLISRAGELVTRDEVVAHLWGEDVFVDTEQGVNTAIRKIRQSLGDDPETPRYVQTVVGKGYRFIAAVHSAVEPPVEPPVAPPPAPSLEAPSEASAGRPQWTWWAVALVALLVLAGWLVYRTRTMPAPSVRGIAVLPFDNLSGDPGQDYLVDGITDELITELARAGSIRVISRTSSVKYKHPQQKLPQIARDLNVDMVLEGAVSRSGNRVHVTVQLIRAASDDHIWAQSYERDVSDITTLQTEITAAITRELRLQLAEETSPPRQRRPVVREAYLEYLRGRYAWNLRREPALLEAIDYFQRAIALDPNFAPAYSGLADTYTSLGYINARSPDETFLLAKPAAERALQLDTSLAEPHASLAYYYLYYERNWNLAEQEFRRAIALNPNYPVAHDWYGVYLTARGRWDEALKEIERARELDPLSAAISTDVGFSLYYSGKYDQAIASLHNTLRSDPQFPLAHLWLGRAYEEQGNYAAAIAEFRQTEQALGNWPVAMAATGWASAVSGDTRGARKSLAELETMAKSRYVSSYAIALVYAGLGQNDQAFRALDRAVQEKTNWLVWTAIDPRWRPIRHDPRFAALLRQIGPQN